MNQDENSPWQYKSDSGAEASALPQNSSDNSLPPQTSPNSVAWQATEFIEHPHGPGWYGSLVLLTAFIAVLVYLTTKDYFATGTILALGIIVGFFASHKPGQANYEINRSGLSVNGKPYPFSAFKSFTVMREGPLSSVNLLPLKRFMPPVSAYFAPAEEQKIVNALGNYLPYEERKMDSIDRLTHRLRL